MRITYPIFETPFNIEENKGNILVIENQKAFGDFVTEILNEANGMDKGQIALFKNFEKVKFDKIVDITTDIITLDSNNKKILSKLYAKLSEVAFEEGNYNLTLDITGKINDYLLNITQSLPCAVSFDENVELNALFKSVSLRVETDDKSILERLCDYIEMMQEFCHIELFVFVQLKSFLGKDELGEFYKFVSYKNARILLIENVYREKLDSENVKIIDSDLCEIACNKGHNDI